MICLPKIDRTTRGVHDATERCGPAKSAKIRYADTCGRAIDISKSYHLTVEIGV